MRLDSCGQVRKRGERKLEEREMTRDIVGTWALVRAKSTASDGTVMPPPYGGETGMGRVTFSASGRMICVLCDGRTSLPDGETREYNSYCGNYTFDGTRLVTRVDAAASSIRVGGDEIRLVRFEGDLMVLQPPVRQIGQKTVQREMSFQRISST